MLLLRQLRTLQLLSFAACTVAQVEVGGYQFNVDGCIDPNGLQNCYNAANEHYLTVTPTACNDSRVDVQNICLNSFKESFEQATLSCMTASCWNKVATCEFQLAAVNYLYDLLFTFGQSDIAFPPMLITDNSTQIPGSCACNIGLSFLTIYGIPGTTDEDACTIANDPAAICTCCDSAARLSGLHDLCPNNDLSALNVDNALIKPAQSAGCDFLSGNGWQASASSICPAASITPSGSAGYLNPLTLPAGFLGSASLTNLPGSVTDLSQLAQTTNVDTVVFSSAGTYTITYATSGSPATGGAGATASNNGAASPTSAGTASTAANGPASASTSKTGGAGRHVVPYASSAIIPILAVFLSYC